MLLARFCHILFVEMRIVLQKVLSASVSVEGKVISQIGKGIMCLVGLRDNDEPACSEVLAKKILVYTAYIPYVIGCPPLGRRKSETLV